MKNMMKILSRYLLSAAGIALILFIINSSIFVIWTVHAGRISRKDYSIPQLADGLRKSGGIYTLSESARNTIENRFNWAMLLDENGNMLWSNNLPSDIPLKFTISDVAVFSRWYLNDYPVYVWRHPDGLFVLGMEKGSVWKHNIEMSQRVMDYTLVWIPAVLILNGIAAMLLALLFSMRLFRSLKALAKGIEDMAEKCPVELPTRGLLGDLAAGINKTSAQLIRQETALNKRDNARASWIAGVSHDIRTPLSIVMGYASQLESDLELPQSGQEQASIIRRQSERIKALVNDLNLATKLEYDMQPIRHDSIHLAVLVRSIAAVFINSGLSSSHTIDVSIGDSAQNIVITGDRDLLERALANLIANSIRHNPKGCRINVTLIKETDNCFLSVSDDGTGFPQEILENLNKPNDIIKLQNHGLGLTIVQQIIKAHGGTAEFHNLPAGGCTAVLLLQ